MQGDRTAFREISLHCLLTEFYLESELEISEEWTETSGVFFSEIVVENGAVLADYCCEKDASSRENLPDDRVKPAFEALIRSGNMIGAYSLSRRFGVTVLDYIAVKKDARQKGLGSIILSRIKEKCRENGVEKIYLTAKAREFFLKNGAKEISDALPLYGELLGECAECPQRGKECFPSVMEITV